MFGILLSAFNAVLSWLVRSVLVKFGLFFGLWFVTTEFLALLVPLLPVGDAGISSFFGALPNGVRYWLQVFRVDFGVPLVINAAVTAFIIRRLPIVG